jgi:succinoglycan biosynthesis protein ExoM
VAVGPELEEQLVERVAMTEIHCRRLGLSGGDLREVWQPALHDTTEEPRPARVTIGVVTYRRPLGLARLLDALSRLEFARVKAPACTVLVVDNDPEGSAATVCDREQERLPWPLAYVHEPRRGISQARNAAVRHGIAGADWLAFIDDDEIPEPCWLDELLHVQRTYAADVVGGPVVPMFQLPAAPWIVKGNFFALPRYTTGTSLDRVFTGNVLVSARVFREMPDPFDERLGLSGGEDVQFFRQVARRGYRLVWADEALAHECIPPSRVTAGWLLRRAYRAGNNSGVCDRDLGVSWGTVAGHTLRAIARIVKGLLLVPPSAFLGRHVVVKAVRTAALGAGYLAGVVRLRYDEYRTTHGV